MASFSQGYVFGFATAVCVVCSVAVAGVSMSLRERQDLNKERDLRSSILSALGLPKDGSELQGEEIDAAWEQYVQQRFITPTGAPAGPELDQDGDGDLDAEDLDVAFDSVKGRPGATPPLLGVYVRIEDGALAALAIPMVGNGLWGPLSGYLALDPKGDRVTGATFFAPKETPGLGAEIMEVPFESQWIGKEVVDDAGKIETVRVVKGEAKNLCPEDIEHCVDGVSGATITSRGVDAMVARALAWYDPYLSGL
ncbi:MAG TPA: NADH:ubiquinone reductase (Na(+)-transporting) subunit C [Deltaproteobacteria bacterium]|nr:NADH:ubiquinone reductase (Na(+)-transporting) subunit C [Deltaproteobacteria bacterium]